MGKLRIAAEFFRAYRSRPASRDELTRRHDRAVERLLRFVHARSPFYREHHAGYQAGDDWRFLPVVNKALMMAHFDSFNTRGVKAADAFAVAHRAEESRDFAPTIAGLTVGLSSGTSGNRGIFLVSPAEKDQWSGYILGKLLPEALRERQRVAFFLRANSNLYESIKSRRVAFQFYDLSWPFEELTDQLAASNPTVLVAPPAALALLASAKNSGALPINPRKVISVADVLEVHERESIERAFGMRVGQVYQATEGLLGVTCPYGTLHLNEDIIAVQRQPLDGGRFTPIITDLRRRAQPIIRYALDDVLRERETPCLCGSTYLALDAVEGRKDDIIYAPGSSIPIFPDFIRRAIVTAAPSVSDYQFSYSGLSANVALAVPEAEREHATAAVATELTRVFADRGLPAPLFVFSSDVQNNPLYKRRRVVYSPRG